MSNTFGNLFRITTFGESHGAGIGVVIDGCPAGLPLDLSFIQSELDRRKKLLGVCIEKLPKKDQQLVNLRYERQLTIERTAESCGRTVQAVYKALSRLRAALFDCVDRALKLENQS